ESLGKVHRIAAARKTKLGRRKMAVNEVWMKEAVDEMEGLKGKTSVISTGATHNARKYYELDHEGKKDLNVVVSDRNRIPKKFNVGAGLASIACRYIPSLCLVDCMQGKLWMLQRLPMEDQLITQNTSSSLSSSGSNDRVSEDTHGASQKDESQRLLEAAEEIAKLMRRDYRGRPLPRPPIHNNEPKN
ncbi:hypothetical protein NMG60_11028531, partial [Bertholletia excelsa]